MNELLAYNGGGWALRLFAYDRLILSLPFVLCFVLWATSTGVLVMASPHDGGRVVACHYFTGTRVLQWQYGGAAGGSGWQGCPLARSR